MPLVEFDLIISAQHREAIAQRSRKFVMALIPFLTPTLTDEAFNEIYLCCHEVNIHHKDFALKVSDLIIQKRKSVTAENALLYRKLGNVQLDQNIGDMKILMAVRINLTDWAAWDQ